jgi:PAS domain S-box-containing protein
MSDRGAATQSATILVVDDESASLALLTGILTEEGYRVRPADSGELALASLAAARPDLILMDLRLPGMDGFEVCQRLKAREETRKIPLMFISASTEIEERVKGFLLGAVDYVTKPFERAELMARVRTHLELSRLQSQLEQQVAMRTDALQKTVEQLQGEIAERNRAERALSLSEERFRLAQSAADLVAWDWDLQTNVVTLCGRYAHLCGLTSERTTLTYEKWISVIHPGDREQVQALLRETLERTHILDAEYRVRWQDGTTHWLSARGTVLLDDFGRPIRALGVSGDVTDRKQAEEALRASQERLKQAECIAHLGHWDWDIKANRVFSSEEALRIAGRPQDYTPSCEEFYDIVSLKDKDRVEQWVRDCLAEKRGNSIDEVQIARPDGDLRTVAISSAVLLDENGMPAHMVGTCQDITDSRRAQNEAFARQKLESIGTLASGIAHDFNNMLGGILAQSELTLTEIPAGSPAAEGVNSIKAVAMRAAEVVRQLLDYAGQEGTSFEPVDLSRIVSEMLPLLEVSISKQSVLKTDLAEELPAVQANASQMRRIVLNLITNASEALAADGGVITVRAARVRRDVSSVAEGGTDLPGRDCVQLEVSDTGCGMSEEIQARMFDPFFTTKFAGRGLGLAAVQGIVRSHGGTIKVHSAPGQGTRIEILLPCADGHAGDDRDAAGLNSADKKGAARETVLFVEDEETLRTPTSKMLQRKGFSVLEASDGRAAVDLFRTHKSRVGVVLLDLTLPGMDGKDVLAEVRRMRPDVKVILTTAYSEEMAVNAVGGHDWAFIRKPYQIADLVRLLRDVLSA